MRGIFPLIAEQPSSQEGIYSVVLCSFITVGVITSYFHILYMVIHKSLRDFRLLRYSSRDGHAEGEHVNRGRDTPSFCPTLQMGLMNYLVYVVHPLPCP